MDLLFVLREGTPLFKPEFDPGTLEGFALCDGAPVFELKLGLGGTGSLPFELSVEVEP